MKKLFFVLSFSFLFFGCATYINYNLALTKVERPENIDDRYGSIKEVEYKLKHFEHYLYENNTFKIIITPQSDRFSFTLENKTEHSISIIWEDAVYINENGFCRKVIPSGNKTVIAKGSVISDDIIPKGSYYYTNNALGVGRWKTSSLFTNSTYNVEDISKIAKFYVGKTVKILVPIQIKEVINDYIFSFEITGYVVNVDSNTKKETNNSTPQKNKDWQDGHD
jgi:hypothetical protein